MMDFSQFGEQELILRYLEQNPDTPRYCVDIGAFDGITGSNSRALLLQGWSGLLVEPDPRSFRRIAALYADRPDVRCIRRAISGRRTIRLMQFCTGPTGTPAETQWQYGQMSTLQRSFAERTTAAHEWQYRSSLTIVTTLTCVLQAAAAPQDIGFMSIDCEGEDLTVIRSLDFDRYRPRLMCIECDDSTRSIYADPLEHLGYRHYEHTQSNTLFTFERR